MTRTDTDQITQAVTDLCEAVPDYFKLSKNGELYIKSMYYGSARYETILPIIAQHAKHWAATTHDWRPLTYVHDDTHSLYLVDFTDEYPAMGNQTKWYEFDPTKLGDEELNWIRAVTEMAGLMK